MPYIEYALASHKYRIGRKYLYMLVTFGSAYSNLYCNVFDRLKGRHRESNSRRSTKIEDEIIFRSWAITISIMPVQKRRIFIQIKKKCFQQCLQINKDKKYITYKAENASLFFCTTKRFEQNKCKISTGKLKINSLDIAY